MKKTFLPLLVFPILLVSCTMQNKSNKGNTPESFMPMQIGNYWKVDAQNYTEIKDTLRIDGNLYYQFYSLVGGDAVSKVFLRIDENKQLVESWPSSGGKEYVRARFGGKLNESFFTLNDKSANDYKVTIVEKSDRKMTFSFDMIYHDNLKGQPHLETYIKGQGFDGNWNEIKIAGKLIK
ncbi:hypothetical protein SD427_07350 [Chryseobacterium sp. JJR-5R]|uniref:hypothetical protein n=1 Tax=Chryseobacterium sp. JJR-5R TaxID=3093923 RepID=UPI002A7514A1|nr:hypothetical protein [Chryseobacterium sp. JJR-5R]WPO84142.1 hypothetical protein SD427_07350 [Chryseobacterium sp. JJR-5R]